MPGTAPTFNIYFSFSVLLLLRMVIGIKTLRVQGHITAVTSELSVLGIYNEPVLNVKLF